MPSKVYRPEDVTITIANRVARAREAHRDAMFEIMLAFGVDVNTYPCFDDLCFGGRGCPTSEDVAIEAFSDLWEIDEC